VAEYITDTHSLLWYFARPKLLGPGATAAFAEVAAGKANLIVPVVVAETLARGATLITRDQAITAAGLVPVVW
jgi:PIN domain nuclease of toxin-antitoxin system